MRRCSQRSTKRATDTRSGASRRCCRRPVPWHNERLPQRSSSQGRARAVSSAVEHCLHTAGVAGSNPAPPTKKSNPDNELAVPLKNRLWRWAKSGPKVGEHGCCGHANEKKRKRGACFRTATDMGGRLATLPDGEVNLTPATDLPSRPDRGHSRCLPRPVFGRRPGRHRLRAVRRRGQGDRVGNRRPSGTGIWRPEPLRHAGRLSSIVVLVVSSATMWWKRRPRGSIGVPLAPEEPRALRVVAAPVLPIAIVFPLVGLSLIVAYVLDRSLFAIRGVRSRS